MNDPKLGGVIQFPPATIGISQHSEQMFISSAGISFLVNAGKINLLFNVETLNYEKNFYPETRPNNMEEFNFSPAELQPPDGPVQRYPVKIIFGGKVCGYYLFGKTNEFEIYFDVKFQSRPGSRFICLRQAFHHEDECRKWLNELVEALTKGQDLNNTDPSVELLKNPDPNGDSPYIWP